jgi:hypothetical protein
MLDCPYCGRLYKVFDKRIYPQDQSICPACQDSNLAKIRAMHQKIELSYAKKDLARWLLENDKPTLPDPKPFQLPAPWLALPAPAMA